MLAENAALSIKCTLMALRFTQQISAIFSHVLKVSGNQCCKPILRLTLPTNLHAYRAHTLSPATELTRLHERKNARRHLCMCVLFSHRAWTLSGDAGALPVLQFQLLTLNQSFLIYLKGFVPWTLMPAPIRRGGGGTTTTQQQWKSQSKSLLWCDYIHNQIRTDLNRHRTQNHIRRNSMCMALPLQISAFSFSSSLRLFFSSLHFSLPFFCHHHDFLLIFQC